MSRFFGKTNRNNNDSEKLSAYESDTTRLTKSYTGGVGRDSNNKTTQRYIGSFAPNPSFIRLLRFFLYTLTSAVALTTAGFGIGVVHYYNSHKPSVDPAWGSLIAVIVFSFMTPGVLFGLFLVTPRLFRHGGVGALLNQTRIELVMLFNLSVFWISGALALAVDLRGQENCIWDGYYHYPKPSDFQNVCNLINYSVIFAYITFGLCAIQMVIITSIAIYILLFLDQEVLTEPTNDMGGRAYRARMLALASHQSAISARNANISTSGPRAGDAPMSGGTVSRTPSSRIAPRASFEEVNNSTRYRDELHSADEEQRDDEEEEEATEEGVGYYGFENTGARGRGGV